MMVKPPPSKPVGGPGMGKNGPPRPGSSLAKVAQSLPRPGQDKTGPRPSPVGGKTGGLGGSGPPSTPMHCPVIQDDSGPHRNRTRAPTSSTVPVRLIGIWAR